MLWLGGGHPQNPQTTSSKSLGLFPRKAFFGLSPVASKSSFFGSAAEALSFSNVGSNVPLVAWHDVDRVVQRGEREACSAQTQVGQGQPLHMQVMT